MILEKIIVPAGEMRLTVDRKVEAETAEPKKTPSW